MDSVGRISYHNVDTVCIYCGTGCGMNIQVMDGEVVGVLPAITHPVSQGQLCVKGWHAADFAKHPDRLRAPLLKKGAGWEECSWEQALDIVAERLGSVVQESGPDAVGFLSSAKCSNEENYLLQKLARAVIGTNNVDHCARL